MGARERFQDEESVSLHCIELTVLCLSTGLAGLCLCTQRRLLRAKHPLPIPQQQTTARSSLACVSARDSLVCVSARDSLAW